MVRTQIQLADEQSRILKAMALEKGISVAELIRRCIENYIQPASLPQTKDDNGPYPL